MPLGYSYPRLSGVLSQIQSELHITLWILLNTSSCPQTNGFQFDATKGKLTIDTILALDTAVKNVTVSPISIISK